MITQFDDLEAEGEGGGGLGGARRCKKNTQQCEELMMEKGCIFLDSKKG